MNIFKKTMVLVHFRRDHATTIQRRVRGMRADGESMGRETVEAPLATTPQKIALEVEAVFCLVQEAAISCGVHSEVHPVVPVAVPLPGLVTKKKAEQHRVEQNEDTITAAGPPHHCESLGQRCQSDYPRAED